MFSRVASRLARNVVAMRQLSSKAEGTACPVMNYPQAQVSDVSSGLRVVSEARPSATATIGLTYEFGSRFDSEQTSGSANLINRLLLKGTTKRSEGALREELDNIGADLTAQTTRGHSSIFVNVPKENVAQALDILADIAQNPRFEKAGLEAVVQDTLADIRAAEADPQHVTFDFLHKAAFRDTPMALPVLGSAETVSQLTLDHLKATAERFVFPGRMVLSAVGGVDAAAIAQQASSLFTKTPANPVGYEKPSPAHFTSSHMTLRDDCLPTARFAYAFPVPGSDSAEFLALHLIRELLGDLDTAAGEVNKFHVSPLISNTSSEMHPHQLFGFYLPYADTGLLGVFGETEPYELDNHALFSASMMTELATNVDADRFQAARNALKTKLFAALNSNAVTAAEVGTQVLFSGRRVHPAELAKRLDELTPSVVHKVAEKYFYDREFVFSAVGSLYECPDWTDLRHRSYKLMY